MCFALRLGKDGQLLDSRFDNALIFHASRSSYGEGSTQRGYCSAGIFYIIDYCISPTQLLQAVLLPATIRREWVPDGYAS